VGSSLLACCSATLTCSRAEISCLEGFCRPESTKRGSPTCCSSLLSTSAEFHPSQTICHTSGNHQDGTICRSSSRKRSGTLDGSSASGQRSSSSLPYHTSRGSRAFSRLASASTSEESLTDSTSFMVQCSGLWAIGCTQQAAASAKDTLASFLIGSI